MLRSSLPPARLSYDGPGNYGYIDNVRFLSMISIVLLHSGMLLFGSEAPPFPEKLILQLRTFGVPLLFVNSAFLMAHWLKRHNNDVRGYWKSRLYCIGVPWVFWLMAYLALDSYKAFLRHERLAWIFHNELLRAVFFTPFWFVPVLFFSLALMIPLRRYWDSHWLGIGSLILTLIYGVNLYEGWFPNWHMTAFFGYLFPMWIGIQLYRRFDDVSYRVSRLPRWLPIAALCVTLVLAIKEFDGLHQPSYGSNALQLSNLLYAFAVLLLLMKFPYRLAPSFVDSRKETFGIYLTHQFFLLLGVGIFHLLAGSPIQIVVGGFNEAGRIAVWFLVTTIVFAACLLATKLLRSTSWAWTVGDGFRTRDERRPAQITPAHSSS